MSQMRLGWFLMPLMRLSVVVDVSDETGLVVDVSDETECGC